MADVVLCFSGDGDGAARLVAARLAARGYRIWSEDQAGSGPITERIAAVRAAIVLWSAASRASEWVRAEANFARGQGKLVQATLDESPPPLPFDPRAAIPLAGWTGEEDHPGWARILDQLGRLAPPTRSAAPAAGQAPPRAVPRDEPRRGRKGGLALAAILFLIAAAAGAFLWMRGGPPYGGTAEPEATATAKAEAPPPAPPPPPDRGAADLTPEHLAPAAQPPPEPQAPVQGAEPRARPPAPAPPAGPRINRRNAENMRLFCERAGRGTAECRRFQQQLRRQGR